jgi:hypothetical protein
VQQSWHIHLLTLASILFTMVAIQTLQNMDLVDTSSQLQEDQNPASTNDKIEREPVENSTPLVKTLKGFRKIKKGHHIAGFQVTSGMGNRIHPTKRTLLFHNGVDIATPIGTPLYAPYNFKLYKVINETCGLGFIATLRDNPTIRFGACHLTWLTDNDQVREGHLFARTGNSGASTGPHLHINQKIMVQAEWYWVTPRHELITPFLIKTPGPRLPGT